MRASLRIDHYASGDASIARAIRLVRDFARERAINPNLRAVALRVVASCGDNESTCIARMLYDYVRRRLRWRRDPRGLDTVADPLYTFRVGGGDCANLSAVYGALAAAAGLEVVYVLGKREGDPGALPSHILPAVRVGGRVIPAEVSIGVGFGRLAPGFQPLYLVRG